MSKPLNFFKLNTLILHIMHALQPKHLKISKKDEESLLRELNVSKTQLPKIKKEDLALPENCETGDIIKIERKEEENSFVYYRVVI